MLGPVATLAASDASARDEATVTPPNTAAVLGTVPAHAHVTANAASPCPRLLRSLIEWAWLGTAMAFAGPWWWPLDLAGCFRVQYAGLLGLAMVWAAVLRRWRWAVLALFGVAANGLFIASLYLPAEMSNAQGPPLSIIHYNVHTSNTRYADACAYLRARRPDIVFAQEVNAAWSDALRKGLPDYVMRVEHPREDNFGVAMLVRVADADQPHVDVLSTKVYDLTGRSADVPVITALVRYQGREVAILSIHTLPPLGALHASVRGQMLEAAGRWVVEQRQLGRAAIVVGDLNITPYNGPMKALMREAGLESAAQGRGPMPTFPAYPWAWLVRIPIDHALHTRELSATRCEVGPASGSDHLPLEVDLHWRR